MLNWPYRILAKFRPRVYISRLKHEELMREEILPRLTRIHAKTAQ